MNEKALQKIAEEDLARLADYDAKGILCGATEDGVALSRRMAAFQARKDALAESLSKPDGVYEIDGLEVRAEDAIAPSLFESIASKTRALYGFSIDWVPGFYVNPRGSLLFGGCSYSEYDVSNPENPVFFALFIIRRVFQRKRRWLIYSRDELLAHELCHVARAGLNSTIYEETLAYQTSNSVFRRIFGGMFYRPADSYLFLGAAFLLLLVQCVRVFAVPAIPLWPFIAILIAVFAALFSRHAVMMGRLARARQILVDEFGEKNAWLVLFRCTDDEINALARFREKNDTTGAHEQIEAWTAKFLRWRIIRERFKQSEK